MRALGYWLGVLCAVGSSIWIFSEMGKHTELAWAFVMVGSLLAAYALALVVAPIVVWWREKNKSNSGKPRVR